MKHQAPMGILYLQAEGVGSNHASKEIEASTAQALLDQLFPGKAIQPHNLVEAVEFRDDINFKGQLKLVPNALLLEGDLLKNSIPQYRLEFALSKEQLFLKSLYSHPEKSSAGAARALLMNLENIARKAGVTEIHMTAGMNDGGWLWAKHGFNPVDSQEYDALKSDLRNALKGYKKEITTQNGTDAYAQVLAQVKDIDKANNLQKLATTSDIQVTTPEGPASIGRALLRDTQWFGKRTVSPAGDAPATQKPETKTPNQQSVSIDKNFSSGAFRAVGLGALPLKATDATAPVAAPLVTGGRTVTMTSARKVYDARILITKWGNALKIPKIRQLMSQIGRSIFKPRQAPNGTLRSTFSQDSSYKTEQASQSQNIATRSNVRAQSVCLLRVRTKQKHPSM